jgi:hypothetical protein
MDRTASRVDWHQALAAYVEPLVADRRVAIFGDASDGLAARLVELGARSVFVWDPDAERARREADRAPHGVIVRALASGVEGGASRGAFDLALVADLELFDDAEDVVANVRRLVGERGAAVVAAPNRDANRDGRGEPGAFDYYELFDLVARQFDEVTMIAQLPFHGVALAELGEDDDDPPSVTVDMQLARDRAPEAFVALASQGGVRLDRYAIVELPGPPVHESAPDEVTRVALVALEEAQLRVASLEASLQAVRDRASLAVDLEAALVERTRQLVQLAEEVEQARAATEIERVTSAKLEEAARRADRADAQLEEVALRAGRADAQLDELALRAERAETQMGEAVRRAERAEHALASFEPELVRLTEAHAAELARYEEGLRDRASMVRGLEVELGRRERMVKELVDALDEAARASSSEHAASPLSPVPEPSTDAEPFFTPPLSAEPTEAIGGGVGEAPEKDASAVLDAGELEALHEENARLRLQLDSLALDLARREGEAHAAAWTIAELQRALEIAALAAPPPEPAPAAPEIPSQLPEVHGQLAVALDEIDVLRQALAQEHAARLQAESNEDLAKARAEIKRQAARLEELGDRSFGDRPD